ncbi:zinc-ribbon domain-containing protein [Sulfitobacter sp. F26204]|uniref:zinc-ribbon domain-containing protein n=1 Tax=Sulfitobacter sp. F26204 TaxID=2996014 RepID=UPI00225E0D28|nr:zinc-ribbon domain-containing protein [Sulfitobacter sp. F26204]MCX7561018.1 zinc-ribbon domain-containing protein [Sulfitobacter sp. F26204]
MRLTCPNCDAQYEVPDEVVPASGRDVQCSNCGKTWFQEHPDHASAAQDEPPLGSGAPDPDEEVSPPPPPAPPPPKDPPRKQLDPAVADILRQEAEAEFEARKRRQSETLESQPDLGLDTGEHPSSLARASGEDDDARALDARRRMARLRGETEPVAEAAATAAAMSSRRELLPDIEEINSTLRNDQTPSGVDADARAELGAGGAHKKERGFRRGFFMVVILFLVLLLIYTNAPRIAATVPALDGILTSYVAWVDQLRVALDGHIKALLGWLDSVATQSAS